MNPFHSVKLLAYGGSVVLVTTVAVLIHPVFHKSKKQKLETITSEQTIQTTDSGSTDFLPGKETGSLQKLLSDSLYRIQNENIISSKTEKMAAINTNQNDPGIKNAHAEKTEKNKSAIPPDYEEIKRFNQTYARSSGKKEQAIELNSERKKKPNYSSEPILSLSNVERSDKRQVKDKNVRDLNVFLSEQGLSRQVYEHDKHNSWISKETRDNKNSSNGMKLSAGNKVANKKIDKDSYFRYGFSLPLLHTIRRTQIRFFS